MGCERVSRPAACVSVIGHRKEAESGRGTDLLACVSCARMGGFRGSWAHGLD